MTNKKFNLGGLECLAESFPPMPYLTAKKRCAELGPGWRIPSMDECMFLQELHNLGVGNFRSHEMSPSISTDHSGKDKDWHWTSDEYGVDYPYKSLVWGFYAGEDGGFWYGGHNNTVEIFQSRPVRTI